MYTVMGVENLIIHKCTSICAFIIVTTITKKANTCIYKYDDLYTTIAELVRVALLILTSPWLWILSLPIYPVHLSNLVRHSIKI